MKQLPYIYKVTNLINGKSYIGQHDGSKSNYYASGSYIKKAIAKHGKENFTREILIQGDFAPQQVDELECYYIQKYKTYICDYPDKGYNLTLGGQTTKGYKASAETRRLISLNNKNKKEVLQYSIKGVFIKEYKSIIDASCELNIIHSSISRCCTKEMKYAGGFIWRYKTNNYPVKLDLTLEYENSKKVVQYSLSGELIAIYKSIQDAAKSTTIIRTAISNAIKGITKTAGDFQ